MVVLPPPLSDFLENLMVDMKVLALISLDQNVLK